MRKRLSFHKHLLAAFAVMLLGFLLFLPPGQAAAKEPIPAGCPGSNRDGPPAPSPNKNDGNKTVCDIIPAGCPGSTQRGKEKDDKDCPYANTKESARQVAEDAAVTKGKFKTGDTQGKTIRDVCGGTVDGEDQSVGVAINIGCDGKGNPIADAAFAVIRIFSNLVGLVIIGSIIFGGIQYAGSRGDPQSTAMAVNRIRSSLFALILFIFGYAILNYLIPAGFLG